MPRGSKDKYTEKQKRKAEHIEEEYEDKGMGEKKAAAIAWATVNKQSGGGEKKGGSGRETSESEKSEARSESAQIAAETRKAGRRKAPTSVRGKGAGGKASLRKKAEGESRSKERAKKPGKTASKKTGESASSARKTKTKRT